MTEQEAARFYTDTLNRLRELGAGELVLDIESTVARGRPRTETGGKAGTLQTPLSPREALAVALHMLVAAVEPPIQVQAAEQILGASITWDFDELEPRQLHGEAGPALFPEPSSSSHEFPQLPLLGRDEREALRGAATKLLELARQLEEHGNADTD